MPNHRNLISREGRIEDLFKTRFHRLQRHLGGIVSLLQVAVLAVDIAERRGLQNDCLYPCFRWLHDISLLCAKIYQLCQKLCQPPLPQLGALCQPPLPQLCQPPLPQLGALCQPPLPQPPLFQPPLPQPPLRQPTPPPKLSHSATMSVGSEGLAGSVIAETALRILVSRSAIEWALGPGFATAGSTIACVVASADEIPRT